MSKEIPGSSLLNYSVAGVMFYCGEFVAGENSRSKYLITLLYKPVN